LITKSEGKIKMNELREEGYQERKDSPQVLPSSAELLNAKNSESHKCSRNYPMPSSHLGCGYDRKSNVFSGSMSAERIFVLDCEGNPLTPCKTGKARKLLFGRVAEPIWNKFNQFGIRMLVPTRKERPMAILGIDFGTKYEGYSLISGKENPLNVMWKLPDKEKIIRKLNERRNLRRARRQRNCRRRECRVDNRSREGFITPSQKVIVDSRLKAMREFFKCYPIQRVAIEDVKFDHSRKKWGKNFSTVEVGKSMIYDFVKGKLGRENLYFFSGIETGNARERYGLEKSYKKSEEVFNTHCSDAFAIARELTRENAIPKEDLIIVDDTYRPVRRRLHDSQFSKGGIRHKYSSGNFRGIRKGTICNLGQIVGGKIKVSSFCIRDWKNERFERVHLSWLSHNFKIKGVF
jgi:hypothetical protein